MSPSAGNFLVISLTSDSEVSSFLPGDAFNVDDSLRLIVESLVEYAFFTLLSIYTLFPIRLSAATGWFCERSPTGDLQPRVSNLPLYWKTLWMYQTQLS